jgi:cytochrome oxidase Cu insertion factor (SCO1/SenC/PrrC family)
MFTDDNGRMRRLSELAGFPVILLPIYTRCQSACVANVDQLKKTLADSSGDPRQFCVLLFSFDSTESPSTLARYRTRANIPLAWSVGAASQENIDALLESIGFQVGKAGTEFAHANLLIFLDSTLRIANGSMEPITRAAMSIVRLRSPQARAIGSASTHNCCTRFFSSPALFSASLFLTMCCS